MGRHKLDPLRLPADGTITRALYDAFATGEPVNVSAVVGANKTGFYLEQLRSMYGCEISPGRAAGRGKMAASAPAWPMGWPVLRARRAPARRCRMSPASLSPQRTESCSNSLSVHSEVVVVHTASAPEPEGCNPLMVLLGVSRLGLLSLLQVAPGLMKGLVVPLSDHLQGSCPAANPSRPN